MQVMWWIPSSFTGQRYLPGHEQRRLPPCPPLRRRLTALPRRGEARRSARLLGGPRAARAGRRRGRSTTRLASRARASLVGPPCAPGRSAALGRRSDPRDAGPPAPDPATRAGGAGAARGRRGRATLRGRRAEPRAPRPPGAGRARPAPIPLARHHGAERLAGDRLAVVRVLRDPEGRARCLARDVRGRHPNRKHSRRGVDLGTVTALDHHVARAWSRIDPREADLPSLGVAACEVEPRIEQAAVRPNPADRAAAPEAGLALRPGTRIAATHPRATAPKGEARAVDPSALHDRLRSGEPRRRDQAQAGPQ